MFLIGFVSGCALIIGASIFRSGRDDISSIDIKKLRDLVASIPAEQSISRAQLTAIDALRVIDGGDDAL